jgi:hypothetical protein
MECGTRTYVFQGHDLREKCPPHDQPNADHDPDRREAEECDDDGGEEGGTKKGAQSRKPFPVGRQRGDVPAGIDFDHGSRCGSSDDAETEDGEQHPEHDREKGDDRIRAADRVDEGVDAADSEDQILHDGDQSTEWEEDDADPEKQTEVAEIHPASRVDDGAPRTASRQTKRR